MHELSARPLPFWRLVLYTIIFVGCAAVTIHEVYYGLAGEITTGTVVRCGRVPGPLRPRGYWAEYEYFDDQGARHVSRSTRAPPVTQVGDVVEVQYLRHSPDTSRLPPSPAAGICFGSVAALAAVVFVGELVVRRRKRRRHAISLDV